MDFTYLKDFMDRLTAWRMPGNCVSVYVDGKEVFQYCSGYADVENKIEFTPDRLVNIYSCSKVTTVVAALQLYEKGYFLLDTPVAEFIPEFADVKVNADGEIRKANCPLTMRHLFTHTSGLTYDLDSAGFRKAMEITGGKMDTLTVAKCIAAEDCLTFDPGEMWQYSLSHDVLAAVVSAISGKKFRDYVSENIFEPLGMTTACYHNEKVRDQMAEQYRFVNDGPDDLIALQSGAIKAEGGHIVNAGKAVTVFIPGSEYDSGGAGITVSVPDYAKLAAALANYGMGANGERILSEGTVDLMRWNQLSNSQIGGYCWGQLKGYGYGLGVRTCMDVAASGTNGSLGEFGWGGAAGANILVDPDENIGVFYAHHMLNPQEDYYQPRLRNVVYTSILR